MRRFTSLRRLLWIASVAVAGSCWGATGPALVVHDGTAGIEADALGNLTSKLTTAGYTVTPNVGVPGGSLATYEQVWDIRFNNTTPLTGPDIAAYIAYMAGGGSLFVMGENAGFATRNNTILTLITTAGGGTVSLTTPLNVQTVFAPFTGPTALSTITFLAANGTTNPGTGTFITKDSTNIGAAWVYSPGSMSNALAGSLIVVFDVNFMQAGADANSQVFLSNLVAYLAAPVALPPSVTPVVPTSVPALSLPAILLLACGLVFFAWRMQAKGQMAA